MNKLTSPAKPKKFQRGEEITEQSHARTTDVNFIVDQFNRTGILKHSEIYASQYGELPSGDIYEEAQTQIASANQMFQSLPPGVRQEFPGGTQQFLEFLNNEENREEMTALGLSTEHLPPEKTKQGVTPAVEPQSTPQAPQEPVVNPDQE